jgi:ElaB/YqjD/DUF883 family membrane-anchored ribosome-binding protein
MPHDQQEYQARQPYQPARTATEPREPDARQTTEELQRDLREAREQAGRVAADAKETVSQTASQAAEKATEMADQAREKTAGGMESAADTVREQVAGKGGIQETVGTTAADTMEKTASYLRENDTQAMLNDIENYVREHPAQAVLGAVAVGFLVGRILR